MATKRFDKHLHILVTAEESQMLEELAESEGLRPSDAMRQLIRRAHAAAFGKALPTLKELARKRLAELDSPPTTARKKKAKRSK